MKRINAQLAIKNRNRGTRSKIGQLKATIQCKKQDEGGAADTCGLVSADVDHFIQVFVLTKKAAESVLGYSLASLLSASGEVQPAGKPVIEQKKAGSIKSSINIEDLLLGETVGTGQFGLVKIARVKQRCELFALKVLL